MATKLNWKGKSVTEKVVNNVSDALGEFGLRVEGNSKKELVKGHGVVTSTLRRSIHTAEPGYNWQSDDVVPSPGSPERGNQNIKASIDMKRISILVGSGMRYAMAVHQGHGKFKGYHYMTIGLKKARKDWPKVLQRHKLI